MYSIDWSINEDRPFLWSEFFMRISYRAFIFMLKLFKYKIQMVKRFEFDAIDLGNSPKGWMFLNNVQTMCADEESKFSRVMLSRLKDHLPKLKLAEMNKAESSIGGGSAISLEDRDPNNLNQHLQVAMWDDYSNDYSNGPLINRYCGMTLSGSPKVLEALNALGDWADNAFESLGDAVTSSSRFSLLLFLLFA